MFVRTKMFWGAKSVALVGVLALLAGCSGDGEKSPSPTASSAAATVDPEEWRAATVDAYESLELPEEFYAESRASSNPSAVAATDAQPGLVVAQTNEPDERPQVGLWTVEADGTVTGPKNLDVGEYATDPIVASDGESTVIVGRAHDPHEGWGLFIARSSDRVSWDVEFDAKLAKWTPVAVAVADERLVLVGTRQGEVAGMFAYPDGPLKAFDLPDAVDPTGQTVEGVATDGSQVVILRNGSNGCGVNTKDVTDPIASWQTFSLPKMSYASDIVRLRDRYLVTGSTRPDVGLSAAAAWTSTDGATWTPEAIDFGGVLAGDTYVEGLGAAGDSALGFFTSTEGAPCAILQRSSNATWHVVGHGSTSSICGFLGGAPLPRTDGGATVAIAGNDALVFDQITPEAGWVPSKDHRTVYWVQPRSVVEVGGTPYIYVGGMARLPDGTGVSRLELYVVEGDSLVNSDQSIAHEWAGGFEAHTSPAGITVVISSVDDGLGVWRYTDGDRWERAVAVPGMVLGRSVVSVGDGWNLLTTSAVYQSEDGLTWSESTKFSKIGSAYSVPAMLCPAPGGEEVLLLAERAGTGENYEATRPEAWLGADDSWRKVTVTDSPAGEFTGCVSDGTTTLISGSVSERVDDVEVHTLWSSTDGRDWSQVELDEGSEVGDPVALDDGFAAPGSVDGEPVVWLSDGKTWEWIPAPDGIDVEAIFPAGSDALLYSEFGAPTLTRLSGVAERIAQL